jgi:GGDEF domain-containing protein
LALFACLSLLIFAIGAAVLMYPVVYYNGSLHADRASRIAFLGFCALSVLLTAYLWESNATIRRLRRQLEAESEAGRRARRDACEELLRGMPKLDSFQDRLAMEFRRTIAAGEQLSILVISFDFSADASSPMVRTLILADVAKAVSRKLSEHDSVYLLGKACLGIVLHGLDAPLAQHTASLIAGALIDAGGVHAPFTHKIDVVNYPQNASSEHELSEAVSALMPRDNSKYELAETLL